LHGLDPIIPTQMHSWDLKVEESTIKAFKAYHESVQTEWFLYLSIVWKFPTKAIDPLFCLLLFDVGSRCHLTTAPLATVITAGPGPFFTQRVKRILKISTRSHRRLYATTTNLTGFQITCSLLNVNLLSPKLEKSSNKKGSYTRRSLINWSSPSWKIYNTYFVLHIKN
jgi:stalled ribosome alternative rescue factor ArfA